MHDRINVQNNPINRIDPYGLFDLFGFVEGDVVGILGLEGGVGVVVDLNKLGESGVFATGAGAIGANLGIAAGGGFAIRDIEGVSYNLDINAGKFSPTFSFDDEGFNGAALAVGPGMGASFSVSVTKSLTINDIIDLIKEFLDSEGKSQCTGGRNR